MRDGEHNIVFWGLIVALVVTGVFVLYGGDAPVAAPSGRAAFAACLSSKGVTMYGTDTCPACQTQKEMFDADFKNITYINCDINPEICTQNDIKKWPTWMYNGKAIEGVRTFGELAGISGCGAP